MARSKVKSSVVSPSTETLVRQTLVRVADKWTLVVIEALGSGGELRFSRLRERVGGVSQKMLTKTLRQLERDGLVTRRVHAVVPPRVDYQLTALGESLGEAVCAVWLWVEAHASEVERARRGYDGRAEQK
jgi:DNA-binding HxlR family transcriptional regulator